MVRQRDLQLNSGMRCVKFMLITISLMFALTAVLLVMVGSTIQAIFGDLRQFIDDHFLSPPALLVAIGFILLSVAALGAYGAIKESVMLINLYSVLLFLIFILEVAAAIAATVLNHQVRGMLERTMNESLLQYSSNDYIQAGVDFMQSTFGCCGVNDPADWIVWEPNQNVTNAEVIMVPQSCCAHFSEDVVDKCDVQYQFGCLPRLHFVIFESTLMIATGAATVSIVTLLGVLCAFMLAKTLRRNKSIREARRWQLQQSLSVLMTGGKVVPPINSPMTGYTQLNSPVTNYTQLEKSERCAEDDPITPSSPSVN